MAFLLIILSVIVTIASAIYVAFKIQYQYWARRDVPHLEPKIPFGNLRLHGKTRHMKDVVEETYKAFRGKTPIAGMYVFSQPIPLLMDLDHVHHILIEDFSKFHDRGLYHNERDDPLSANLLTLDSQKWRSLRSKLTPTFTSGKMKFMYPTMLEVMKQFNLTLREILHQQSDVEIKGLLARFTMDVIGTCAFGIECNSLKDPNTEFLTMGRRAFESRHGTIARILLILFPDLARKLHVKSTRDDVSEFFMNMVRQTVAYREENNVRRNDFMDILIQLKNGSSENDSDGKRNLRKMSFEEVAAQAYLFFLAGFETSSTNMTYSLYELAMNQDIQERARLEIEEVLERHGGEFTYDAMMELDYIDRINKESLRKYPPFSILMRIAKCDYPVPGTNIIIEKNSRVLIPVYSIQHDPDIYPDPEVFDPDRFLPEQVKTRHPMSFLALGDGPRNCIGARFGQMQSRIGLVSLLRNFRFTPCSKTPPVLEFSIYNPILMPKDNLWLKAELIEK